MQKLSKHVRLVLGLVVEDFSYRKSKPIAGKA